MEWCTRSLLFACSLAMAMTGSLCLCYVWKQWATGLAEVVVALQVYNNTTSPLLCSGNGPRNCSGCTDVPQYEQFFAGLWKTVGYSAPRNCRGCTSAPQISITRHNRTPFFDKNVANCYGLTGFSNFLIVQWECVKISQIGPFWYACHSDVWSSAAFFKKKLQIFLDTLILLICFLISGIHNLPGNVKDISSIKVSLVWRCTCQWFCFQN